MTSDILSRIDTSAALPEGYSHRAATQDDAEAFARVTNAALEARGEEDRLTAELVLRGWQNPKWDLSTSSQVVLNPTGELIGHVTVSDIYNPTHPGMGWDVRPGDDWDTVMRFLIAWGEQRALQALERCQPEERFAPATGCLVDSPDEAFLASLGYQPARYFYHMAITFQEAPAVLPLPAGFVIATFDYPAEMETLAEAYDDMWQDHFGYIKRPVAEIVEDWKQYTADDPKFDATMWFIARHEATGEIAGIVLCDLEDETQPNEGHVALVGVRRAYRKQGLAQAMITHAFAEFWRRGQKTVGLGVDASSPTGATRLYERLGMSVTKRYVRMEKELRPGIERMNTGH